MSDFIKLHDKDDGKDVAIRIANIETIYDISSIDGTLVVYRCGTTIEDMYVVEDVSEILRIIERQKVRDEQ